MPIFMGNMIRKQLTKLQQEERKDNGKESKSVPQQRKETSDKPQSGNKGKAGAK